MSVKNGAAASGGYVRTVFSQRVMGCVAPLDLVRACLRARIEADRRGFENARVRGRLAAAFSGYLAEVS